MRVLLLLVSGLTFRWRLLLQDLGTVAEQPHAATPSQPEDVAAEQQAAAKPGKPPSGNSGANSPRTVHSSADAKGLGPRHASSNNGKVSAAGSEAGLPPLGRQSSNLANRIAAYASGVAPVRRGITNADEDSITVEDVLHKLETAGRVGGAQHIGMQPSTCLKWSTQQPRAYSKRMLGAYCHLAGAGVSASPCALAPAVTPVKAVKRSVVCCAPGRC